MSSSSASGSANTAFDSADATAAAAGWGGDRIALLDGPGGAWGVVLRSAWDSPADAAQFEAAATPWSPPWRRPASLLPGAGGTERWLVIGSDDATLGRLAGASVWPADGAAVAGASNVASGRDSPVPQPRRQRLRAMHAQASRSAAAESRITGERRLNAEDSAGGAGSRASVA